ncbi:hypothetical protein ACOSQ4_033047 [Xanthoceras sorbifolium]
MGMVRSTVVSSAEPRLASASAYVFSDLGICSMSNDSNEACSSFTKMTCPSGEVSTTPSPLPLALLDLSTAKVHSSFGVSYDMVQSSSSAYCRIPGVKYAMKYANTCDLIIVRGW